MLRAASIVYLALMSLAVFSLLSYIRFRSPNRCKMTYMYQYPEYIEINLNKTTREKFPDYHLFVYGEGYYADQLRKNAFDGIPVLFIPGNAGSYKQVRSLASVSMVKSETAAHLPKFNYFSVDLNEELSALYGNYLIQQTKFTAACIEKIFKLYAKHRRKGTTDPYRQRLIIVGHSMGGIIARGLIARKLIDSSRISLVISLATPIMKPVTSMDLITIEYYRFIEQSSIPTMSKDKIFYVNIGGGFNDIMVRSDLATFQNYTSNSEASELSFSVMTSSMTHVWATTDHLCIVWCNELVRLLVRMLFDLHMDDPNEKLAYANEKAARSIIRYHLITNDGRKTYRKNYFGDLLRESVYSLHEVETIGCNKLLTVSELKSDGTAKPYSLKFVDKSSSPYLFLRTNIHQEEDQCFLVTCKNSSGEVLSSNCERCTEYECYPAGGNKRQDDFVPQILPDFSRYFLLKNSLKERCFFIHVSEKAVSRISQHYVLASNCYDDDSEKLRDQISSHGEINSHVITVGNPIFWTFAKKFGGKTTAAAQAFINVTLNGFYSVAQAFQVRLIAIECTNSKILEDLESIVLFSTYWNTKQNLYGLFKYPYNESDDFYVALQYPHTQLTLNPSLLLFLNPHCRYTLEISSDLMFSLIQIIRFYYEQIIFVCVLMILAYFFANDNQPVLFIVSFTFTLSIAYLRTDSILSAFILLAISSGLFVFGQTVSFLIVALFQRLFSRCGTKCLQKDVALISVTVSCLFIAFVLSGSISVIVFAIFSLFWLSLVPGKSTAIRTLLSILPRIVILVPRLTIHLHLNLWFIILTLPTTIVRVRHFKNASFEFLDFTLFPALLLFGVIVITRFNMFNNRKLTVVVWFCVLFVTTSCRYIYELVYALSVANGLLYADILNRLKSLKVD